MRVREVYLHTRARLATTTRTAPPNSHQPADVSNVAVKMLTRGAFGLGPSADEAGASRVRRVWAIGALVL